LLLLLLLLLWLSLCVYVITWTPRMRDPIDKFRTSFSLSKDFVPG
jgi:hypothetical protein